MTAGGHDHVDRPNRNEPSQAVVEAIAEAEDVPTRQVRPPTYESLHAAVDPEALDRLFAPRADGTPRAGGQVSFPFCGYDVTVEQNGSVTLEKTID
ncbi:HalOD1 output domain-containing protein [Natronorubrum bangense]|uniref:Halobacterial output domain-containing protein n=2 Tax=Natronorubrum bangense TaxID=61858 RepID=L9WC84_9EURY|nr:HalOD1 output domain-containing protein [Natronorubrum bangense]ELY47095.1 hypothetical protein C494_12861 [Natronorubrum bangense JCM 10635]QCC53462.1 hypothetical protein DV706_02560 [Natronorubrum bangense]